MYTIYNWKKKARKTYQSVSYCSVRLAGLNTIFTEVPLKTVLVAFKINSYKERTCSAGGEADPNFHPGKGQLRIPR